MIRRLLLVIVLALAVPGVAAAAPVVTGIDPVRGPATGGTTVTISGSGFVDVTSVRFGTRDAQSFTVVSETSITAVSPPGAGVVEVAVTSAEGTGTGAFSYVPVVSTMTPTQGSVSGDTEVTIAGAGFTGATAVRFGDRDATSVTVVSDTEIRATSPEGGGTVDVTVTGPGGTSSPDPEPRFTYLLAVTGVNPSSAPGGTQVRITGIGFAVATKVRFGASFAGFAVLSDTELIAVAPPLEGVVDVRVETPYGTSPVAPAARFTYVAPGTTTGPTVPAPGTPTTPSSSPGAGSGIALAVHSALRVKRVGGFARITGRLRIDRPARVTLELLDPRGRPIRIGPLRGGSLQSLLRTTVGRAGLFTVALRARSSALVRGKIYRLRVTAVAADGARRTLIARIRA